MIEAEVKIDPTEDGANIIWRARLGFSFFFFFKGIDSHSRDGDKNKHVLKYISTYELIMMWWKGFS